MTRRLKLALSKEIKVDVDYYSPKHRALLDKYPSADRIREIAGKTTNIPASEFYKNSMFHRVRHEHIRHRDAEEERRQVVRGYNALEPWIAIENGSLNLTENLISAPNHVAEQIGESIGLSVANRIFRLTEADWVPIGVGNKGPSFDYETASTGDGLVQLEMKGSAIDDTTKKASAIYAHSSDINEKKVELARSESIERIGSIVAFPKESGRVKCWLLDPEPDRAWRDPRRLRLLSRLHFIQWIIWLVAPRSRLAMALATRIAAVSALLNPFELADVPLLAADGKPLAIDYPFRAGANIPHFFLSRSHVSDGPAGGIVVPIDKEALLFIGFRDDLLHYAVKQQFDEILSYRANEAVIPKLVQCVVRNDTLRRFGIDPAEIPRARVGESESRFELPGALAYTAEGLVFGEVSIGER